MNKIFYFKNFYWPKWLILFFVPLFYLYFSYTTKIINFLNLSNQNQYISVGIAFVPFFLLFLLINYFINKLLRNKSYLEVKNGFLNFIVFSTTKWSISINTITNMDSEQGHYSPKTDFWLTMIRRTPEIGFHFIAQGQSYEVKSILDDFEEFKQTITALNPSISFESVTRQINKDFANQDLGKTLQENAHGSIVLTSIGKLISKLTASSAFIIGIIITSLLIVWAVIATK